MVHAARARVQEKAARFNRCTSWMMSFFSSLNVFRASMESAPSAAHGFRSSFKVARSATTGAHRVTKGAPSAVDGFYSSAKVARSAITSAHRAT
jgi:hypothetical protein